MTNRSRNTAFFAIGFGTAVLVALFLSPFASQNPDGLDRVSLDHGFDHKAAPEPPAHRLPFYSIFNEYKLRGVPAPLQTPLAGLTGTLVAFGLAWGAGKLFVRGNTPDRHDEFPDASE